MTDLTTAQKRKLIRELDKASALHKTGHACLVVTSALVNPFQPHDQG